MWRGKASCMNKHKLVCHKTRWLRLLAMTSLQCQGVNMRDGGEPALATLAAYWRVFGNSNAMAAHVLEKALDPQNQPTIQQVDSRCPEFLEGQLGHGSRVGTVHWQISFIRQLGTQVQDPALVGRSWQEQTRKCWLQSAKHCSELKPRWEMRAGISRESEHSTDLAVHGHSATRRSTEKLALLVYQDPGLKQKNGYSPLQSKEKSCHCILWSQSCGIHQGCSEL